ncbi:MAG: hypothetical protein ABMA64_00150 [Myxococcota bacterium]
MWRTVWVVVALAGCKQEPGQTGVCSTDDYWTGGNEESPLMRPGGDCITCHASDEGPNFASAGTVMGEFDDEDDCNGVAGVTVRITDANDEVWEYVTNAAGNFFTNDDFATPYAAEVEFDGVVSQMLTAQTDGNCAACHTAEGANGAPGRIVSP